MALRKQVDKGRFQSTLSMRRATNHGEYTGKHTAVFQSTLSMRRATSGLMEIAHAIDISIHALHEESD